MTKTDESPASAAESLIQTEAARVALAGASAALAFFRAQDPEAGPVWETSGPRKTHTETLTKIMVELDGVRRMMIVEAFSSGAFKVYAEVPGKDLGDKLPEAVAKLYAQ